MVSNNEERLIADLLHYPTLAEDIEIDPEWFRLPIYQCCAAVVNQRRGLDTTPADIFRELKNLQPLIEQTEFDILMDYGDSKGQLTEFYARELHKEWLADQIKQTVKSESYTLSDKGMARLRDLIEEKESLERVKSSGEVSSGYESYMEHLNSDDSAIKTFTMLDDALGGGMTGGQLVIIGARPAVGKSAFGINLAMKAIERNTDVSADFYTLEMDMDQMMNRFIAREIRVNSMLIRRGKSALTPENIKRVDQAYQKLAALPLRIYGSEYTKLGDIIRQIKKNAKPEKYVALVDYAGLVEVADSRKNERQVMNEVTRRLKLLTNELKIPIVLFAQLNRGIETRNVKRPTLADLKESGSLEQDANVVMLMSADEDSPGNVIVDIAKNREGVVGELNYRFEKQYMNFIEKF